MAQHSKTCVINNSEFDFISRLVKQHSGLVIPRDKTYLVESHLSPLAATHGFHTLSQFICSLKKHTDEKMAGEVIEAVTNHESMFFRDKKPFEQLRKMILPRIRNMRAKGSKIRIWSAACATGQEPYSLAICLLEEATSMAGYDYEIIATDISAQALAKAKRGIYTQFESQRGMPKELLHKYFIKLVDSRWQVNAMLRDVITFGKQNLLEEFVVPGTFDLVLCRNALIYFDDATKRVLLEKFRLRMNPGSMLMVGSGENLTDIPHKFAAMENAHGVYVL